MSAVHSPDNLGFYGVKLAANGSYVSKPIPERVLRISHAAIDLSSANDKSTASLFVEALGNKFCITKLTAASPAANLDLYFVGDDVKFSTTGNAAVHLTGYLSRHYTPEEYVAAMSLFPPPSAHAHVCFILFERSDLITAWKLTRKKTLWISLTIRVQVPAIKTLRRPRPLASPTVRALFATVPVLIRVSLSIVMY